MPSGSRRAVLIAGVAALVVVAAGCAGGKHAVAPQTTLQSTIPSSTTAAPTTPKPSPSSTRASSPSSTTVRPTTTPPASCTNARVLATWSARRLAEQTVVIPVDEGNLGSVAPEVAAGAGGVILFGSRAPADLGSSLARLVRNAPGGVAPLVMTDEEGGAVQRMANLVGQIPSARDMASTMTPAEIQRLAVRVGRRMKAAGVTVDLAPVLDLDGGRGPNATNPVGTRSFSPAAKTATADGLAFVAGLRAAGVIPVAKHFPGLGGATGNTDLKAAETLPWRTLEASGLLPFKAAVRAGVPAIMISNASVPGLTGLPASISHAVITGVLRGQLGFSGLVLTDSLSAGALRDAGYSVPRASVAALRAGADMVLYNVEAGAVATRTGQTVQAIVAAVASGELPRSRLENAVLHILAAKRVDLCG
jgi:beta-N-acetylhexosaminidase